MSLFRRPPRNANREIVDTILASITGAARRPHFYSDWGIPDTPLGRYESIGLHMILFLHRTRGAAGSLGALAQEIIDEFFKDVDHSIRELGIGDQSVPKRMKKLARMFYGRMGPYWSALDADDAAALADAVARNIGPDDPASVAAAEIADYMLRARDLLAGQPDASILAGQLAFPEPSVTT